MRVHPPTDSAPSAAGESIDEALRGLPEARAELLRGLHALYPDPRTELDHETPWQLLVATILSAQSTDKGVNQVTPALFARYPDPPTMARASAEELEPWISRLGLFRNKAKSLAATARDIVSRFGGEVPNTREALMTLPGVGRKTANVVLSNAFGIPAFAVDTHVFRVSQRLGLASGKSVDDIEAQLMRVIPESLWTRAHHWLILHGRRVCMARNPACARCSLLQRCPAAQGTLPVPSTSAQDD